MKRIRATGLILLLCVWSVVTYTGLIRPIFIPTPTDVFMEMTKLIIGGEIVGDIGKTLFRLVLGFGLGALIGVITGMIMGSSKRVYEGLEFLVDFFRSVPVTCLFPLFLLFFGIGDMAKIFMAAWSSGLLILINTMYGVRHSSATRKLVVRVMKGSKLQLFREVMVPDALPGIFVGFRTGISLGLIVVVVSEMFLGTKQGLGQVIYNSSLLYETPTMYAAIIYTGIIGYGLNKLFIWFEKRLVHWKGI